MKNMKEEIVSDEEFDLICKYIKIRYESKISQSRLARRVGIARSTISRMKRNLNSISLGTFIKLLEAMNYKLETLTNLFEGKKSEVYGIMRKKNITLVWLM